MLHRLKEALQVIIGEDLNESYNEWGKDMNGKDEDLNSMLRLYKQKNDPTGAASVQNNGNDVEDTESYYQNEIRIYEVYLHLAASNQAAELNTALSQAIPSAREMIAYYQSRPQMLELTLEHDLRRIKHTVYTHEGRTITEPDHVLEYARRHSHNHHVLWRAANQSLFGDVICALTGETSLVRPQLGAGSFCQHTKLVLDFTNQREPHIRGECGLNVSIPNDYSKAGTEKRLRLAGVQVSVCFCPAQSVLRARVLDICPSRPLTRNAIHGAAKTLSS